MVSSACFAECSRWSRASQLGPHKFPYVALANSKEHEVQVAAARPGGRVGRACGTAGPRTSPFDARENFLPEKPNEHESNSPRKARRPTRWERLRFLGPDRRRTGPIGVGSAIIARSSHLRVFDPVSGCLCGLPGSAWAREGGVVLHCLSSSQCARVPVSRAKRAIRAVIFATRC